MDVYEIADTSHLIGFLGWVGKGSSKQVPIWWCCSFIPLVDPNSFKLSLTCLVHEFVLAVYVILLRTLPSCYTFLFGIELN